MFSGQIPQSFTSLLTLKFPRIIFRPYSNVQPRQKPVKLWEYSIKTCIRSGKLAANICVGFDNAAVAAANTDRCFVRKGRIPFWTRPMVGYNIVFSGFFSSDMIASILSSLSCPA